jgi:AcrR family transcriptional regulator
MPTPVGRERLSKEDLAEHQRDRVLAVAAGVFADRGYHATTVDDLVAAARIGVGGFYALFGGKEGCFAQLYDATLADARRRVAEAAAGSRSWPERICAGLRECLEAIAAEPARARVVLIEADAAGPAGRERAARTRGELMELLREGRESSSAEALPDFLEVAAVGGAIWLLQRQLLVGAAEEAPAMYGELGVILLEPYLAGGRREAEGLLAAHA